LRFSFSFDRDSDPDNDGWSWIRASNLHRFTLADFLRNPEVALRRLTRQFVRVIFAAVSSSFLAYILLQ